MKKLILALAIPCFALSSVALYHQFLKTQNTVYELSIEGYDPRDLLAGHYLQFRINWRMPLECEARTDNTVLMCINPAQRLIPGHDPEDCKEWLVGACVGGTFRDSLTRFYIPKEKAAVLEEATRNGQATIKVAVGQGTAVITDLLINGKSHKDY